MKLVDIALLVLLGAIWGALFLGDPLNATMFVGLGIIFVSILLVTGVQLPFAGKTLRPAAAFNERG